ncbi:serpin B8-like [Pomacea canaliculata]|uniref:serpin B8-like n=1 Tax=Pomacea canaliculata TaxID=400727 RepID=UPI000D73BF44|nr:serpin B8-like [Pomacea canaliculata]
MATGSVFILCILLSPCYGDISEDRPLYLATSEFGVNLHKQLTDGYHGNVVFSPLSVYTALSMTLLGADGITKKELESVLGVRHNENVHRQLSSILTSMLTSGSDLNITIDLANALFYDPRQLRVSDSYSQNFSQYYGETLREIQRPDPEREVNSWVNRTTRGSIPELLETGTITEETTLLLINTMFFEAQWKQMFNQKPTFAANFTTVLGSSIQVQTMMGDGHYFIKSFDPLNRLFWNFPTRAIASACS